MFFKTNLPDGAPCAIVMRAKTVQRLAQTCFRGKDRPLSGNFARWDNFREMLEDRLVHNAIVADILKNVEDSGDMLEAKHFRLTFCHVANGIGWSSTTRHDFESAATEEFRPNRCSTARRVPLHRKDIEAPLTDRITLVYELKFERSVGWVAVVHTIYPGEDVGVLSGDITPTSS